MRFVLCLLACDNINEEPMGIERVFIGRNPSHQVFAVLVHDEFV